ncbi:hypothetical protein [Emcibacter sp.]|uniref:hypothetical protein n=1 Tax=Emcibacter sp. TaxID=1979954 RepID=UPI003A94636A
MTLTGKEKIITPPNILLQKMGGKITGIDWEVIERANRSVDGVKKNIAGNLVADLKRLDKSLQEYVENCPVEAPDETGLYDAAFETKGLAGSVGYDLVGKICASLCDMMDKCRQDHEDFVPGLNAHVNAIQFVLSTGNTSESSPINRELLAGLQKIIEKTAA